VLFSYICLALDNGVGRVPAMGYNTWNDFRCSITARDIMAAADAIVRQGLDKVGYVYVNMDDCWAKGRNANGTVYPDPAGFPNGIKAVADYVHSKGLKFGIYSDRGVKTCAGRPGSEGYETIDARTYAAWGVDYLKEDSCNAPGDPDNAFRQYGLMRDALNATGRHIYFSLCGWANWYAPQGQKLGNSWRIAGDCNRWPDVLNAIDTNAPLATYAAPGGWNDPDMLIGSTSGTAASLPPAQSRSMFSMWAVMTAPLLIGSHITQLNSFDLETYLNTEVIAVNQDRLGKQGIRVAGKNLFQGSDKTTYNVWAKQLSDGSRAVCFLNDGAADADIRCDSNCFRAMGFSNPSQQFTVRDLWTHKDIGTASASGYSVRVTSKGSSVLLKLTPR